MEEELIKVGLKIIGYSSGFALFFYGILKIFGKKWLDEKFSKRLEEFKHFQNQEMENYKFQINKMFNRVLKIQEKEFEVLPEIWSKLQFSFGTLVNLTASFKTYPDLDRMTEPELTEYLDTLNFPKYKIDELRSAKIKLDLFVKYQFQSDYYLAYQKYVEFHQYLIINKIFLEKKLFDLFSEIDKKMYSMYISARHMDDPREKWELFFESKKEADEINQTIQPLIENLGIMIQQRLHINDAE